MTYKAVENKGWKIKGALAVALFGLLLPGCGGNEQTTTTTGTTPGTNVEQVAENTDQLIGQTVTVTGEVQEVMGPQVFRLEDQQVFNNDRILVIIPQDQQVAVAEGQSLQVTGEVRQVVVADFERDYNLVWDPANRQTIEAEYEGRPAIIAQSTQVVNN